MAEVPQQQETDEGEYGCTGCLLGWFFSYRTYFGYGLLSAWGLYNDIMKKLPEGVGFSFYAFVVLSVVLGGLYIVNKRLGRKLLPSPQVLWGLTLFSFVFTYMLNKDAKMLGGNTIFDGACAINQFTVLFLFCALALTLGRWVWCVWVPLLTLSLADRFLHYKVYDAIMFYDFSITPFFETLSNLDIKEIGWLCLALFLAIVATWVISWVLSFIRGGRLQLLNTAVVYGVLATGFSALALNADKKDGAYWPINEVERWYKAVNDAADMKVDVAESIAELPSPADESCSLGALQGGEGVIVVVHVGHGIRADHMSINGYKRATTPWLRSQKHLINFPNCYSSSPDANRALINILTNARSSAESPTVGSVLDIFRALGFKLYVSARGRNDDDFDSIMTVRMLSKGALDRHSNSWGLGYHVFDIPTEVDHHHPEQNVVIFVSHEQMNEPKRMFNTKDTSADSLDPPAPFTPWAKDLGARPVDVREMTNAYDNGIHDTDLRLSSIFEDEKLKKRPILYVYVGAYGEYLGYGGVWSVRDPGADKIDYLNSPAAKVGMFVLANEKFEALHQDFKQALEQLRKNSQMTVGHEHVFHTLLGLLNIQSPHRDAQLDLTSPQAVPHQRP